MRSSVQLSRPSCSAVLPRKPRSILPPQLGNGNDEDCAICLEALVVGVEDVWFSLVSPSPIIIRSLSYSIITILRRNTGLLSYQAEGYPGQVRS